MPSHECVIPCNSELQPEVILNESEETKKDNNEINVGELYESNEESEEEGAVAKKHSRRYPQRECNKPKYLEEYVTDSDMSDIANCTIDYCYRVVDVPVNYQNAISSPKA